MRWSHFVTKFDQSWNLLETVLLAPLSKIPWSAWPDRGRFGVNRPESQQKGHAADQNLTIHNFSEKRWFLVPWSTYLGQPARTGAVWLSAWVKVWSGLGVLTKNWPELKICKNALYYILYHISRSAWPDRGRLAISLGQSHGQDWVCWPKIDQSWKFAKMLFTKYYITYLGQPDRTGAV